MAIVSTYATVSLRYYTKKSKDDIIFRIEEMRSALGLPKYTIEERAAMRKQTAWELAWIALDHHKKFPDDNA